MVRGVGEDAVIVTGACSVNCGDEPSGLDILGFNSLIFFVLQTRA